MRRPIHTIVTFQAWAACGLTSIVSFGTAIAQDTSTYGGVPQAPISAPEKLYSLIETSVVENLAGAFLLLILSVFFSTINFYTDVPVGRRSLRGAGRYLAIWIGINYIFALLILLLLAPEGQEDFLSQFSKTLFVYCMFATALPEIAANIRLQFGDSTRSIDLYKYKSQISNVIANRVKSSVDHVRRRQLLALSYQYYDRLDEFLHQLDFLRGQLDLTEDDRENLSKLREKIKTLPPGGDSKRVFQLEREHLALAPKLLAFFEDEINTFTGSPAAHLMRRLQPDLKIDEAQKLVQASVTSGVLFLFLCHWSSYRSRIAERSGIPLPRLNTLYHNTRYVRRQRTIAGLGWGTAAILLPMVAILLFANYEFRAKRENSFTQIITSSAPAGALEDEDGGPNTPVGLQPMPAAGNFESVAPR